MTDISESFDEGAMLDTSADVSADTTSIAPPISEILSSSREEPTAADVTARPAQEDNREDREERSRIPIAALRRERERRTKIDAQIAEMERELERFNAQKLGIEDDISPSPQKAEADSSEWPLAGEYQKAYTAFAAHHGPEKVAEINRALDQLTPSQRNDVHALVRQTGDPQTAVEYLDNAGLLQRAQSIKDVLAGNKPHDPFNANKSQENLQTPEQAAVQAERANMERGSQVSFAQRHGQGTFLSVDAVVGTMLQRNHPLVPQLRQIYQVSPDPTTAVAVALHEWGLWSPQAAQPQRPAPVFPSNLAGARNVGTRSGPAWSGPPSLEDIFDRSLPNGA